MGAPRRWVFLSLVCQHQNLGDLVIRRELVRWVTDEDTRIVALVGDTPDDALEFVELPRDTVLHRSGWSWTRHLLSRSVRRDAAVVFAPGPQPLTGGLGTWARGALGLVYTTTLPVLGNPVLKVGRAVRGDDRLSTAMERRAARRATLHLVRDEPSHRLLGGRTAVIPDLALAGATTGAEERDTVTLCPRAGRSWPTADVTRWVDGIRAAGLRPVMLTQVRFDDDHARALADRCGIEHVGWRGQTPTEQWRRVESEYGRSLATISDRLHALLFAARAGAAPVPWLPGPDDKLVPTLAAADLPWRSAEGSTDEVLAWALRSTEDRERARADAAARLELAREQVRSAVGIAP